MAKTCFVSEAGAHGYAFDGPGSTHFSLTVVLVEEENRREVEERFRRIRERHIPNGNFFPGDGHGIVQRREFLEELNELDFSFHALLVDKRKLHQKSPLQFKGTSYKFLSGFIYNNLYRTVQDLSIVANELGTPEFMESFRRYNYKTRFMHTYELLQHLNSYKYKNYTEHRFRSLVVGPVQDGDVLIGSSSAGYKLPCSTRDIYNFFNYYNQQIQPMLGRLGQCHRALELATGGELNVLEQPEYDNLKKLLAKLSG